MTSGQEELRVQASSIAVVLLLATTPTFIKTHIEVVTLPIPISIISSLTSNSKTLGTLITMTTRLKLLKTTITKAGPRMTMGLLKIMSSNGPMITAMQVILHLQLRQDRPFLQHPQVNVLHQWPHQCIRSLQITTHPHPIQSTSALRPQVTILQAPSPVTTPTTRPTWATSLRPPMARLTFLYTS